MQSNCSATEAPEQLRIAKFLAAAGLGSRRHCESLVSDGQIQVNGEVELHLSRRVSPGIDQVCYRGKLLELQQYRYLLLNKPPGVTCSGHDVHAAILVGELLPQDGPRLFTVGRLDRDSEGLLLCTNDGRLAQALAHPRYQVPKTYDVAVSGRVKNSILRSMEAGIIDDDEFLAVKTARICRQTETETTLEIILTGGRKREIRRLCARHGLQVLRLQRICFGTLALGDLEPGKWRDLTGAELRKLRGYASEQDSDGGSS